LSSLNFFPANCAFFFERGWKGGGEPVVTTSSVSMRKFRLVSIGPRRMVWIPGEYWRLMICANVRLRVGVALEFKVDIMVSDGRGPCVEVVLYILLRWYCGKICSCHS